MRFQHNFFESYYLCAHVHNILLILAIYEGIIYSRYKFMHVHYLKKNHKLVYNIKTNNTKIVIKNKVIFCLLLNIHLINIVQLVIYEKNFVCEVFFLKFLLFYYKTTNYIWEPSKQKVQSPIQRICTFLCGSTQWFQKRIRYLIEQICSCRSAQNYRAKAFN